MSIELKFAILGLGLFAGGAFTAIWGSQSGLRFMATGAVMFMVAGLVKCIRGVP